MEEDAEAALAVALTAEASEEADSEVPEAVDSVLMDRMVRTDRRDIISSASDRVVHITAEAAVVWAGCWAC